MKLLHGLLQEVAERIVQRAELADLAVVHSGVTRGLPVFEAQVLNLDGALDAAANGF